MAVTETSRRDRCSGDSKTQKVRGPGWGNRGRVTKAYDRLFFPKPWCSPKKKNWSSPEIICKLYAFRPKILVFSKKKSPLEIILGLPTFRPKFVVFSKKKGLHLDSRIYLFSSQNYDVFYKKRSSHEMILRPQIQNSQMQPYKIIIMKKIKLLSNTL